MEYKGFRYTPAPKTAWDSLSMLEKSEMMRVAVRNGITDLKTIRERYNEFAEGGDIHIKDSKKGTFTAAASRHGMGVQEFASKVLANKDDYSPAMVKKANFARNARKWHGEGGNLFDEGGNTNPMNYEYRGTVYSDDLKNQGITHAAELPEVIVTGKNPNRPYVSSFDGSIKPYEELFEALSHGLQPLSLSQHVGAAFDAVQGKRNYLESLFNGNSGFFTDNYAAEHPWVSTLGNMAGDIVGGKMFFSGIPKFNKAYNRPSLNSEQEALIDATIKEAKAGETIGVKALSIAEREKGYQRMKDFISSPEYQARLEAAGMGDYRDYMIDLIEKRLNGNNYFPAWQADEILGNKNLRGLSEVDPTSLDYGVTVRSDLQGKDFLQTFDHEIAHFSTENTYPNFLKDVYESWMHSKRPNFKLQRLMRANDKVAPIRKWKEYFVTLDSHLTKDEIAKLRKKFDYVRMGQERRARAYSLVQEAKRRGISTDELVDMYTIEGDILGDAPKALRELNMVYTPENLKKYINGFLSISTPITVGINTMSDE